MNSIQEHIRYTRKEQKFVKFAATQLKAASFVTVPVTFSLFWKTYYLLQIFKVAQKWYITPLTKQWCNALKQARYLWKRGAQDSQARGDCLVILPYYPSLSLQSVLLAKRMWLKWN